MLILLGRSGSICTDEDPNKLGHKSDLQQTYKAILYSILYIYYTINNLKYVLYTVDSRVKTVKVA